MSGTLGSGSEILKLGFFKAWIKWIWTINNRFRLFLLGYCIKVSSNGLKFGSHDLPVSGILGSCESLVSSILGRCESLVSWILGRSESLVSWILGHYKSLVSWILGRFESLVSWILGSYKSLVSCILGHCESLVTWLLGCCVATQLPVSGTPGSHESLIFYKKYWWLFTELINQNKSILI